MTRTIRFLPLCALLLASVAPHARADDNSTLEERMSFRDFTRLGLDKLSPDQLRGLNDWMKAHGQDCAPRSTNGAPAALGAQPAAVPDHVMSRIAGDFTGWEKGTVLVLENGQRWEVRDDDPLIASREKNPAVTVEKGLLGWTMSIAGHPEIAHVIPAGK
ncbi:MAG: hypothetical protein ABW186_04365 [Rhodanobacteraceae bacterium]